MAEGEKAPATREEYAAYVRKTLTNVGQEVGKVQQLSDAMEPVRVDHEGLQRVAHKDADAYMMVAVPDSLVGSFSCEERSKANPYTADDAAKNVYGNYYATMFSFKTPGEHAAALTLLWGKDGGEWKIVAYELVAP